MNAWKPLARYFVAVESTAQPSAFFTHAAAVCFAEQQSVPVTLYDSKDGVFLHFRHSEFIGHAVDVIAIDPLNVGAPQSQEVRRDLDKIRLRVTELRKKGYGLAYCVRQARIEWLRTFVGKYPLVTRPLPCPQPLSPPPPPPPPPVERLWKSHFKKSQ